MKTTTLILTLSLLGCTAPAAVYEADPPEYVAPCDTPDGSALEPDAGTDAGLAEAEPGTLDAETSCYILVSLVDARMRAGQYDDVPNASVGCLFECPWLPAARCNPESWEACAVEVISANDCASVRAAAAACAVDC